MASGVYTTTSYGDIVIIIRAACVNFPEMVNDVKSLEIYIMYLWEVAYHFCDDESRKRQYFCKLFIVNDMVGFAPNPFVMKKFGPVMGAQSKRSEFLYPQFLGMMCVVNAPAIFQFIFKIISGFMSKGFLEKFNIHGALTPEPSRLVAKELPLPFKGDDAACMPTFLGGRCEDPVGLFPSVLPPPPKKTPADLASAASLTTFVQVKYLQRLRDEAAKGKTAGTSTATMPTPAPAVAESATPSNGATLSNPPEVASRIPSESKVADDQPTPVSQSIPGKETSIGSIPAAPVSETEVQIETEPKTPDVPRKGLFGCC
jgi:hypothetical protein